MMWNRSDTIALAKVGCVHCQGIGILFKNDDETPCNCVLRAIFRACYKRFKHCVDRDRGAVSAVNLERVGTGSTRSMTYGRRNEEYIADFLLVTRRVLTPAQYRLFNFHFLLGADWKLCCRRLNIDRGAFFRATYQIEERLGRTFRELQPYALYPLDEYFGGYVIGQHTAPIMPKRCVPMPVRPPLQERIAA